MRLFVGVLGTIDTVMSSNTRSQPEFIDTLLTSDVTDVRIRGCPHQNLTSVSATKWVRMRMSVKLKKNEIGKIFLYLTNKKFETFEKIGIIFFIYGTKKYQK